MFKRLMTYGDLISWAVILALGIVALSQVGWAALIVMPAWLESLTVSYRSYTLAPALREAGEHLRVGLWDGAAFTALFLLLTIRARINAGWDAWAAEQVLARRQRDFAELDGYRPLIDRRL